MDDRQAAYWDHKRDLRKHMPTYAEWLGDVRAFFDQPEELALADAIFPFMDCFHAGWNPKEAYDQFDAWARLGEDV